MHFILANATHTLQQINAILATKCCYISNIFCVAEPYSLISVKFRASCLNGFCQYGCSKWISTELLLVLSVLVYYREIFPLFLFAYAVVVTFSAHATDAMYLSEATVIWTFTSPGANGRVYERDTHLWSSPLPKVTCVDPKSIAPAGIVSETKTSEENILAT